MNGAEPDGGMAARSLWNGVLELNRAPLPSDTAADVCVVGAGIAGLSTAYCLARAGKTVVVLDDGPIGAGMTQHTTGHLSNAIDDRYVEIERLHGADGARRAAESHTAAIDRIEAIVTDEGIDCDFERVNGYLFPAPDTPSSSIDEELEAALRAGVPGVTRLDEPPVANVVGPCLRFARQGQLHPLKYLAGVARAFERRGGRIHCGSHVAEVRGGEPARVATTSGATVTAQAVVVATNTPVNDRVAIHTKQAPYSTYAIAATVPFNAVRKALYWDMADPYHYVRLHREGDATYLIVGGEDH
jgi:glycine/D-amino acid oxidase-like deaminating enzyme